MPYYKRAPGNVLFDELDGGALAFLREGLCWGGEPTQRLDLQFRRRNTLMLYAGGTCPLVLRYQGGRVKLTAHSEYHQFDPDSSCADVDQQQDGRKQLLFDWWDIRDKRLPGRIQAYLARLAVGHSFVEMEGEVQIDWARIPGPDPWTPLDREAVMGYTNKTERNEALRRAAERTDIARAHLGLPPIVAASTETFGKISRELDQLAIDPAGNLVLIELKWAKAEHSEAPLQLLQYVHEWHQLAEDRSIWEGLQDLASAKARLGLIAGPVPPLAFPLRLRPVVAFGEYECDPSRETRFKRAVEAADAALPADVSKLEVWALEKDRGSRAVKPVRLRPDLAGLPSTLR